jgi:hypothetical protein
MLPVGSGDFWLAGKVRLATEVFFIRPLSGGAARSRPGIMQS